MSVIHRHHIIPRHMGGSDAEENIAILSIEDHAEAHRNLYESYGKIEDFIAWKCLSGKSNEVEEERIHLAKSKFKEFLQDDARTSEWKFKISSSLKGKSQSEKTRKKRSESLRRSYKNGRRNFFKEMPKEFFLSNYYENDMAVKMAKGRKKSEKWRNSVTSEEYRLQKSAADPRSKRVSIHAVVYPSVRNASKCSGISLYTLRRMLKEGSDDNIFFL